MSFELKFGNTKMAIMTTCADTTKTTPIAAHILEDESGYLGFAKSPLLPSIKGEGLPAVDPTPIGTGGIMTDYEFVENKHTNEEKITVIVAAGAKPLVAGSHTCTVTIGEATKDFTFDAIDPPAAVRI